MKKLKLLLLLFTLPVALFAQEAAKNKATDAACVPHKWEVGLPLGVANYFGDVQCVGCNNNTGTILSKSAKFVTAPYVRYHLNNNFALRGNLALGSLGGADANCCTNKPARQYSFSSSLVELSGVVEYYLLGSRNYNSIGAYKPKFSPYLFAGLGYAMTNPKVSYGTGVVQPTAAAKAADAGKKSSFVMPLGAGLKYDLSERMVLSAEVGFRNAFSDYLDGVSNAVNTKTTDFYYISQVGLSYRLGDKDADMDGLVDKCDVCPNEKGLRTLQGCPDTDGDGIADKDDACPTVAGLANLKGCPDTDGDGIADKDDACPSAAGLASLNGCPDADRDGIADKDDACPQVAGLKSLKGCPDTDGDGIADKDDTCPQVAGLAKFRGCPDKDGDGIQDSEDKCPDEAGVPEHNGCTPPPPPVEVVAVSKYASCLTPEDIATLEFAANAVDFYGGTNKMTPASYSALKKVCKLLEKCPDAMLYINGYGGTNGTDEAKTKLARLRACAVYAYFKNTKCLPKDRMIYEGYGLDSTPKTNGRVELIIK